MSRPQTEHRSAAGRRFRTPAATRLACAVGIVLLAAGADAPAAGGAQPQQPPTAGTGPSIRPQTAVGAPGDRTPTPAVAGGILDTSMQPTGADAADGFDSALFIGPPEPPWLVGPPAPGIDALAEDLYLVSGYGSNVVARVTPEGVVVAGELTSHAEAIAAAIETVTDRPVRYVLRTNRRGSDPRDLPAAWQDATVVAPERQAAFSTSRGLQPQPEPPGLAFTRGLSLFLGEAEAQLSHFAPAHTGSDAVVLFPDPGVLYAGDLVVRGMPFIDYAAGGSSRGWVETLNGILALEFETAIPGAGPPLTKRDVQVFRDRFVTLRMRAMQLLYRNVAQAEALPLLQTADLDWPLAPGGPFSARSFAALYDELAIEREEAREAAAAASDEAVEETERP